MRPRQGGAEVRTAEWRAGGLLVSAPTTVVWAQRNSFLLATVTALFAVTALYREGRKG